MSLGMNWYTLMHMGVPVKEDIYAGPLACKIGWPVPFLSAFISLVLRSGTADQPKPQVELSRKEKTFAFALQITLAFRYLEWKL